MSRTVRPWLPRATLYADGTGIWLLDGGLQRRSQLSQVSAAGEAPWGDVFTAVRRRGFASCDVLLAGQSCTARTISIPGARPAEVRGLLQRSPARYIAELPNSPVVAALMLNGKWGATRSVTLACSTAASVLRTIETAAAGADVHLRSVSPAHPVWWSIARAEHRKKQGGLVVLISDGEISTALRFAADGSADLRRFPLDGAEPRAREWAIRPGPSVLAIESRAGSELTASATESLVWRIRGPRLHLRSPEEERRRVERSRRAVRQNTGVAIAALLVAAALHIGDLILRRAAAEREIASLASQVDSVRLALGAAARQDSIVALADSLWAITVDWDDVLVGLAAAVPERTRLRWLRAQGDSIAISGATPVAARLPSALSESSHLRGAELRGVVRARLTSDSTAAEEFDLHAIVPSRRSRR